MRLKWSIAAGSLLALIAGLSLFPVSDPDLWIMLATGRELVASGRIPRVDFWSHTAAGQPWVMHEWLSAAAIYLVHQVSGFPGIVILKLLVLSLIFGLGAWAARPRSPVVLLAVFLLAVLAAQIGYGERVQIVTFLGLVLQITVLNRMSRGQINTGPFLLLTAALYLVWANTHLGMMSGLFVMAAYGAESFWNGIRGRGWKTFRGIALGMMAAGLAVLANPYGLDLVKPFFTYYFDPRISGFESLIYSSIHEYTPIFSPSVAGDGPVRWGLGWMSFSLLGLALDWRNFRLSSLIVWLGFFYLAFYAVRFVPLFVFATLIFTTENWGRITAGPSWQAWWGRRGRIRTAGFGVLCLAAVLAGTLSFRGRQARSGGLGLDPRAFPAGGVEFVRANFPDSRLLNDFIDGGFLIWNGVPVFIDGRMSPYREVLGDYLEIIKGNTLLLEKYEADLALLRYPRSGKSASARLHGNLSGSSQWALVYWDDLCLVFAKRTEGNRARIDQHQYRYLNPVFTDPSAPPDRFQAELERAVGQNPGAVAPYLSAFNFYYRSDLDRAEYYLKQGIKYGPEDASLRNNLGNIHLTRGRRSEALKEYSRAIRLDRNLAEAYCNIGYIHQMDGNYRKAESYYRKVIERIDPLNVWVYNQIGLMLVERGRMEEGRAYLKRGAAIDPGSEAAWNLKRLGGAPR